MKKEEDMKYKIGNVAKLLNITPEAIRYYEEQGIVSPDKEDGSGYRLYDVWDIHILIRARSYRQLGFSLAETAQLLNNCQNGELVERLILQEQKIEEEIIWNMNLLKQLREMQAILQTAEDFIGKYKIEFRPGICRIETQDAYVIRSGKDVKECMREWIDKVPFVYPCALFQKEEVIKGGEGTFTFGLGADEADAEFLKLKASKGVEYYPPVKALYTTIRSNEDEILTTQRLQPAMEEMKRRGLSLSDDVVSRVVLMKKEGNKYINIHQLWFPF